MPCLTTGWARGGAGGRKEPLDGGTIPDRFTAPPPWTVGGGGNEFERESESSTSTALLLMVELS